jgi:hypothetical protein
MEGSSCVGDEIEWSGFKRKSRIYTLFFDISCRYKSVNFFIFLGLMDALILPQPDNRGRIRPTDDRLEETIQSNLYI